MATTPGGLMSGPDAAEPERKQGTWDKIVDINEKLWGVPTGILEQVGTHVTLFIQSLRWMVTPPFRVGLFVGMVFALQLTSALRQFGTEGFVGATLGIAVTRELSPVFTSIVVAARAGAGMATELGSMRITEQIDALSTLAVNPIQFLVSPRILAAILMVPLLAMLFNCVGMFGGYGVAVWLQGVDRGAFLNKAKWVVDSADVAQGIMKATIF